MKITRFLLFASAVTALSACGSGNTTDENTTENKETPKAMDVTLTDVPKSPEFPGATLTLQNVSAAPSDNDSARLTFNFSVANYELKSQTGDAESKMCANSGEGQHIHFILDNQPYKALYEPKNETVLAKNSEHYLLCFLSRSYHESLKNKEAAVLVHFKVDENGHYQKLDDPTAPMLFYSRPKGDYLGKDTANVLLDFYPANVQLGNDYSVKAVVKNNTTGATGTFTLNEWKPEFINNLGTGQCSVTISLVDKNGKAVTGPNTSVTRNITLAASEPL